MVGPRSKGGGAADDHRFPGSEVTVENGSFPGMIRGGDYFSLNAVLGGLVGEIGGDHEARTFGMRPSISNDPIVRGQHLHGAAVEGWVGAP